MYFNTNRHCSCLSPQSCISRRDRSAGWNVPVSYHTHAHTHNSKLPFLSKTDNVKSTTIFFQLNNKSCVLTEVTIQLEHNSSTTLQDPGDPSLAYHISSLCAHAQFSVLIDIHPSPLFFTQYAHCGFFPAQIFNWLWMKCFDFVTELSELHQGFSSPLQWHRHMGTQLAGQYLKCQEFCSYPDELLQQP